MTPKPTPKRPARDGELCSCGKPALEVLFFDDLGPVASCGPYSDSTHRGTDCPSWCVEKHWTPFDQLHSGRTVNIELDHHVEQERMRGEWETFRLPLLVGLTKEPNSKPAYIEIIGVEDQLAGRLTAHEADQLADTLHALAATLRKEEAAR